MKKIRVIIFVLLVLAAIEQLITKADFFDFGGQSPFADRDYSMLDFKKEGLFDILIEGEEASEGEKPEAGGIEQIDPSKFENCWAYSTLSKEEQKLYREMYATMKNHKKKAMVSTTDKNSLEKVYYAIDSDHAEIFWCKGYSYRTFTMSGRVTSIEYMPRYEFSESEVKKYQKKIDKNAKILLSKAKKKMSNYEKAKYVYDVLIQNVDYDLNAKYNQTIVSSLANGKTVCKGYAGAAQYLLRKLGIESVIISGKANGGPHAWNAVKLDGNWYYYDVTWGNSQYSTARSGKTKYVNYDYLNITTQELSKTHRIENFFAAPKCTATKDNYYRKENRYVSSWNQERVGAIIRNATTKRQKRCGIKFADSKLYSKATTYLIKKKKVWNYCRGVKSLSYIQNNNMNTLVFEFR